MSRRRKIRSWIGCAIGLIFVGCSVESVTQTDGSGNTSALNGVPGSYVRYRVRAESPEVRCNRKVAQIAEVLAAAGQRPARRPELSHGREGVMLATRGQERFYCYLPSGQVEFFDIARMRSVAAPTPSRGEFLDAAKSFLSWLEQAGLLDGAEVSASRTSFAEFQTGMDAPDLGVSTQETTGARVVFRREVAGLPVLRNSIAIRLDLQLRVVSLKLAWTELEGSAEEVPTSLTPDQALEEFYASNRVQEPRRITGFLAAGLLESQDYLEPWHVFGPPDGGAPLFARPAVQNLAPLKAFGVVEATLQQRR